MRARAVAVPSLAHRDPPSQRHLQIGLLLQQTLPWGGTGAVEMEEIRYCYVGVQVRIHCEGHFVKRVAFFSYQ